MAYLKLLRLIASSLLMSLTVSVCLATNVKAQATPLLSKAVFRANEQSSVLVQPLFNDDRSNIAFYAECPTVACPAEGSSTSPKFTFFAENTGHGYLPFSDYWAPDPSFRRIIAVEYLNADQQFTCAGLSLNDCLSKPNFISQFAFEIIGDTEDYPAALSSPTLQIVTLIVNGESGLATPTDFNTHVTSFGTEVPGSPAAGVAAPGTAYALPEGDYQVFQEPTGADYIQSFLGDCDNAGLVTLGVNQNKLCTVINTHVSASIPPTVVVADSEQIIPLVGLLMKPNPLVIPAESGEVTYDYIVWNVGGQEALTNVTVIDDVCGPVNFLSGDLNDNGVLDPEENWLYSCTTTLTSTTTNTAIVTAYSSSQESGPSIDTAIAIVIVGPDALEPELPAEVPMSPPPAPVEPPPIAETPVIEFPDTGVIDVTRLPPLIDLVKLPNQLTPFPARGGQVTYSYTVTNPGLAPMHDVVVKDDGCEEIIGPAGDNNSNGLLDATENWTYTCQTKIEASGQSIGLATGQANGFTALSYAFSTVLISAPNTPRQVIVGLVCAAIILGVIFLVFARPARAKHSAKPKHKSKH